MRQRTVAKKVGLAPQLKYWQHRVMLRSRCLSHFFRGTML